MKGILVLKSLVELNLLPVKGLTVIVVDGKDNSIVGYGDIEELYENHVWVSTDGVDLKNLSENPNAVNYQYPDKDLRVLCFKMETQTVLVNKKYYQEILKPHNLLDLFLNKEVEFTEADFISNKSIEPVEKRYTIDEITNMVKEKYIRDYGSLSADDDRGYWVVGFVNSGIKEFLEKSI